MKAKSIIKGLAIAACLTLACLSASAAKRPVSRAARTADKSASTSKSSHAKKTGKKKTVSTRFVPKQKAPTADRISEIQSALSRGDYYKGEPNGRWDSDTIAAMQKFQSANGMDPSGKLDAPTLQKLGLGSDIAGVSAPRPPIPSNTQSVAPPASVRTPAPTPSS